MYMPEATPTTAVPARSGHGGSQRDGPLPLEAEVASCAALQRVWPKGERSRRCLARTDHHGAPPLIAIVRTPKCFVKYVKLNI